MSQQIKYIIILIKI